MDLYKFLINDVLCAWPWSDSASTMPPLLGCQGTCVPTFVKISELLLKLLLAEMDRRTVRQSTRLVIPVIYIWYT